jgi:Domain of unknown function (DUF4143)
LPEAAFMIQRLPAWGETLGKKLASYPKVHLIDSGLAGWLLGLSAAKVNSRDPRVLTEFGHLVETFAVGEIFRQVSWSDEIITETWDGRVAAFEVKAGTRIRTPISAISPTVRKTASRSSPSAASGADCGHPPLLRHRRGSHVPHRTSVSVLQWVSPRRCACRAA